jgi:hypothetical protein
MSSTKRVLPTRWTQRLKRARLGFTGSLSGDVTGTQGATHLADGSVTTAKFASGATAPNAAALNGIGASGFLQGAGHYAVASGVANGSQPNGDQRLLYYNNTTQTPAGNYYVVGDCNDTNAPGFMRVALGSYAFQSAQVWMEVGGSAPTYTTFTSGAGGDFAIAPTVALDGGVQRVTWHVFEASGQITITAWSHSVGSTCTFTAEAMVDF